MISVKVKDGFDFFSYISRRATHMKSEAKKNFSIPVKSIFDFTGRPLALLNNCA